MASWNCAGTSASIRRIGGNLNCAVTSASGLHAKMTRFESGSAIGRHYQKYGANVTQYKLYSMILASYLASRQHRCSNLIDKHELKSNLPIMHEADSSNNRPIFIDGFRVTHHMPGNGGLRRESNAGRTCFPSEWIPCNPLYRKYRAPPTLRLRIDRAASKSLIGHRHGLAADVDGNHPVH